MRAQNRRTMTSTTPTPYNHNPVTHPRRPVCRTYAPRPLTRDAEPTFDKPMQSIAIIQHNYNIRTVTYQAESVTKIIPQKHRTSQQKRRTRTPDYIPL